MFNTTTGKTNFVSMFLIIGTSPKNSRHILGEYGIIGKILRPSKPRIHIMADGPNEFWRLHMLVFRLLAINGACAEGYSTQSIVSTPKLG